MSAIPLNQEQEQALSRFSNFLESRKSCFILTGGAGTGKTTLIRAFCEVLEKRKKRFLLLSPTGRASRVLQEATGRTASTIHSAIYAYDRMEIIDERKSPEAKEGLKISFKLRDDDLGDILLIVDEASMVGDKESENEFLQFGSGRLLKDLLDFARISPRGEGPAKAKVVFVGDPVQLPPVGETDSPALSRRYLKENHGVEAEVFELTQVMRQKQGGAVLRNAHRIRESVISGLCLEFGLEKVSGEVEEITGLDALDLLEEDFSRSTGNSVLITHSNAKALRFNEAIRERLWKSGSSEIQPGDILLVNRNDHKTGLCNGDIVRVVSVEPKSVERNIPIKNISDPVRLRFREVSIVFPSFAAEKETNETRVLILENLLDSPKRSLSALEQRALLVDFTNRHRNLKRGSKEFLLELSQDSFFNALQVKYGYAMTCHKAQGGEWERGVVNFEPRHPGQNPDFFRWAYTAVTRAKKTLLVINPPSFSRIDGLLKRNETSVDCLGLNAKTTPVAKERGNSNMAAPEKESWERFRFADQPGFLWELFQKIRSVCDDFGVEISDLKHLPYRDRYSLHREGVFLDFDVIYRKNGQISDISELSEKTGATFLFDEVLAGIKNIREERPTVALETLQPFLKKFVEKLTRSTQKEGIRVVAIETKSYRLRVFFEENGNEYILDFLYDSKERWTQIQEIPPGGMSDGFKGRIQSLIEGWRDDD